MLPDRLISVYQEYKKDTNSVTTWLASTAKAAGCSPSLLGVVPTTSGRLKGKARKLAQSTKLSPTSTKNIIPVSSFIPLAEYIMAQKNPTIPVPASVISTIERAISARAAFATQLFRHGETPDTEETLQHSHFVTVLKRTRDILSPRARPPAKVPPAPPSAVSSTPNKHEVNSNRFHPLKVDKPSKDFTRVMEVERPEPAQSGHGIYEAEEQTSRQDACEVLFMLYSDLQSIRHEIVSSWLRFQDNFLDLSAVALGSNTAMDLARFIIQQAEPVFEPHGGLVKFSQLLAMLVAPVFMETGDNTLGHRCYSSAADILRLCLPKIQNDREYASWGRYELTASRDCMSSMEKLQDDCRFLTELFWESVTFNRYTKGFPVMDEFTREVGQVLKSKQLSFFLIFAGQVALDINHHIRKDVLKPFNMMKEELLLMNDTIESYLSIPKETSKANLQKILDIRAFLRSVKEDQDPVFEWRQRVARENNTEPPPEHYFYKLSPVLCGLTIFHFRARLYEFSTQASAITAVQDVAHLYNALSSEGMLNTGWGDLDGMEMRLGVRAMFNCASVDNKPQGTKATFKSLALQKGTSISALKKMINAANDSLQLSHPIWGKSCFESAAPLSRFFMERYVHKSGRVDMRPEDVEKILSLSDFELAYEENGIAIGAVMKSKGQCSVSKSSSKSAKNSSVSPDVLTRSLSEELNKENLILSFPFLLVESQCCKFLLELCKSCSFLTVQKFGSTGFGHPETTVSIASFILLCNFHELAIGRDMYRLVADEFHKKLSTTWGRAGLDRMKKIYHVDGFFENLSDLNDDDVAKLFQRWDTCHSRMRATFERVGTFSTVSLLPLVELINELNVQEIYELLDVEEVALREKVLK